MKTLAKATLVLLVSSLLIAFVAALDEDAASQADSAGEASKVISKVKGSPKVRRTIRVRESVPASPAGDASSAPIELNNVGANNQVDVKPEISVQVPEPKAKPDEQPVKSDEQQKAEPIKSEPKINDAPSKDAQLSPPAEAKAQTPERVESKVEDSGNYAASAISNAGNKKLINLSNVGNVETVQLDGVGNHRTVKVSDAANAQQSLAEKPNCNHHEHHSHKPQVVHHHHHHSKKAEQVKEAEQAKQSPLVEINIREVAAPREAPTSQLAGEYLVPVMNSAAMVPRLASSAFLPSSAKNELAASRLSPQYMLVQQPAIAGARPVATPVVMAPSLPSLMRAPAPFNYPSAVAGYPFGMQPMLTFGYPQWPLMMPPSQLPVWPPAMAAAFGGPSRNKKSPRREKKRNANRRDKKEQKVEDEKAAPDAPVETPVAELAKADKSTGVGDKLGAWLPSPSRFLPASLKPAQPAEEPKKTEEKKPIADDEDEIEWETVRIPKRKNKAKSA